MKKEERENFKQYFEELINERKLNEKEKEKFTFVLEKIREYATNNNKKPLILKSYYYVKKFEYYFIEYNHNSYLIRNSIQYNNKSLLRVFSLKKEMIFTFDIKKVYSPTADILRRSKNKEQKFDKININTLIKEDEFNNVRIQFDNINESITELLASGVSLENIKEELNLSLYKENPKQKVKRPQK